MPQVHALVEQNETNLFVVLPSEIVEAFGAGKRPAVVVRVNDVEYRTRVAVYGGRSMIGFRNDISRQSGLLPGATVELTIELDTAPREVTVPDDFAALLAIDADASSRFEALSFTNRREYVEWIQGDKRPETRQRRLDQVLPMLKSGRKTPLG